ncbi:MAG: ABC transporter permease [Pseudoclavibacter sp.]
MRGASFRGIVTNVGVALWLPILVVAVWWFWSTAWPTFSFPPFGDIMATLGATWFGSMLFSDLIPSILLVLQGLGIAIVAGVALGILIGSNRLLDEAVRPFLDFMRGIPKVLLISPALVIIGVGDALTLFVLAFGSVWPILLSTIDGVKGVQPILHDMRKIYHLSWRTWLFRIAVPAAAPQIFAGIRNAVALGVVLLVPSEAVGATGGLGFQLKLASESFLFAQVWATVIVFALLGYALASLLTIVERRVLNWFYLQQGANS